jgi:hypothetical protein
LLRAGPREVSSCEAAARLFAGARHGVWPCARRWCGIAGDGDAVIKRETRASGGCLGTERRRRTWHAAKSPGEMRAIGDPGISEWGNPPARVSCAEFIGAGGKPGELKHLSSRRNRHQHSCCASGTGRWWREPPPRDSVSSGERTRNRPVAVVFGTGSVWKGGPQRVTAPYGKPGQRSSSRAGHEPSCLKMGGPPSKPKYSSVTDSAPVP